MQANEINAVLNRPLSQEFAGPLPDAPGLGRP